MNILQDLKLALQSTLWFFIPNIIIVVAMVVASNLRGTQNFLSPRMYYDFYLFHNIPFFLGSFLLIMLLRKGTNPALSILISNIVAIGLWYFFLFVTTDSEKYSHAAMAALGPGFLAYVVFFLRSFIDYEFIYTDTGEKKFIESKDKNRSIKLTLGIVYLIIIYMFLS